MPCAYFLTGSFQILNSTPEWNTNFLCLSHPQLHMPPTACRTDSRGAGFFFPDWHLVLAGLTASQAHLRALWGWLCLALWGTQNLEFPFQQERGSCASDKSRIFCLVTEPAPSCSPSRAPQQHVCCALNYIPPPLFSLSVTYVKYSLSSRLFSETFWVFSPLTDHMLFQLKWTGGCLQQIKPELVRCAELKIWT